MQSDIGCLVESPLDIKHQYQHKSLRVLIFVCAILVVVCLGIAPLSALAQTCPLGDDSFETEGSDNTDDTCFGDEISVGSTQVHKQCDVDWVYFFPTAGATYRIETRNLVGGADTHLSLHVSQLGICNPTASTTDDNSGTGLASLIEWTAVNNDAIDIEITESGNVYNDNTNEGYDIRVTCIADCATFSDVPPTHFANAAVEALVLNGLAEGCGTSIFCPNDIAVRNMLALWLVRGPQVDPLSYFPPIAGTQSFDDVDIGNTGIFGDGDHRADWIEDLLNGYSVTEGCDANNYCPEQAVDKQSLANLLLKMKFGMGHVPSGSPGLLNDVGVAHGHTLLEAAWMEEAYNEGFMSACDNGSPPNFCPDQLVSKANLARYIAATFFNIPL